MKDVLKMAYAEVYIYRVAQWFIIFCHISANLIILNSQLYTVV